MAGALLVSRNTVLRIVMVDDDVDDIFLTDVAFKRANLPYHFTGFESGRAFFNHIDETGMDAIDVLLLDVNMPAQDGHDVLAKLYTYEQASNLCIIMYSTSVRQLDIDISKHLGAEAYIVKPCSIAESEAAIQKVMDIFEMHQSDCAAAPQPKLAYASS